MRICIGLLVLPLCALACSDEPLTSPRAGDGVLTARPHFEVASATPVWATSVVSYAQGLRSDGTPVPATRSHPASTLGAPQDPDVEGDFFSLGMDIDGTGPAKPGQIVLDFGQMVGGALLVVFETTMQRPTYPLEGAAVYGSGDGVAFFPLGAVTNKESIGGDGGDVVPLGVCVRYVKVVDTTDPAPYAGKSEPGDGFDLDAIAGEWVCPCEHALSRGYYKNHSDWPAPYTPSAPFFSTGSTWIEILKAPARGSGYMIMAPQYIAAVLNRARGVSVPTEVQQVLGLASAYLTNPTASPQTKQVLTGWASVLDSFNNGAFGSKCP